MFPNMKIQEKNSKMFLKKRQLWNNEKKLQKKKQRKYVLKEKMLKKRF